jgi:NAD-dependent deacetylase
LHIRAGNSLQRTFQIHGNINFTRCSKPCHNQLNILVEALTIRPKQKELSENELCLLHCEPWFRFDSSLKVADNTNLLVIVGTSGATALPNHVVSRVQANKGTIIDINPEHNPFSEAAKASPGGMFLQQKSAGILSTIVDCYTTVC